MPRKKHHAPQAPLPLYAPGQRLYWQTYDCGCTSTVYEKLSELPAVCPKHNEVWRAQYVTHVLQRSVSLLDINPAAKPEDPEHIES